ncbi:TIGR02206 family membrane protein [Brevibacterium daeguense]|uniref:TIGR02206 family membrane protein n=1 Tax=Brevibacterium daeguense TaxID=909936 RepID=A0ABP8ELL5_9MICO
MNAQDVFVPYGPTHWAALAVAVLGTAAVTVLGRRLRGTRGEIVFSRLFASVLAAYALAMLVYRWLPGSFDVHVGLPIHLSDVAWMVAVIALALGSQWAFALTYYWGLTLNPQAMLTPALDAPDFPHIDFIDLWVQHILVLWAAVYLTWGRGCRVDWRGYRLTLVVTMAWACVTFGLNSALGTNYGFLNGKPNNPSVLDVFGPWPWYLLVEFLIISGVWALITWPWTVRWRTDGAWDQQRICLAPRTPRPDI